MRFWKDKDVRFLLITFLIAALILGLGIAGFYAYTPVKMHILTRLLRHNLTSRWAWGRIYAEGEEAVPYLVKGLRSKNPQVRSSSAMVLRSLASAGIKSEIGVSGLIELLSHPDGEVRNYAASCLAAFADKRALPGLLKLLSDSDVRVRSPAVYALGRIGDKRVVPDLVKLLSDSNYRVRSSAAAALGEIGDKKPVPDLIKLLSDPDYIVRYRTIEALGKIGSDQAAGTLISSLSDPDRLVRQATAKALGQIGSLEAVGPLIACLKETPMKGPISTATRRFPRRVMEALEKITGQSFGDYRKAILDAELREIIQKWQNWWQENKEEFQEPESE